MITHRFVTAPVALITLIMLAPALATAAPPADRAAEAFTHFDAGEWEKAAAVYAEVVAANPYDGRHWQNYGFALHSLGRYEQAIPCFEKSIAAGFQIHVSRYNIACGYALLGNTDDALDWLDAAYENGMVGEDDLIRADSDLDSLREHPRFQEIVCLEAPAGLSREEGIRHDMDVFAKRMKQVHFHLYKNVTPEAFHGAIDALARDAGGLTDLEVAFRLQQILALVGDGHTGLRMHRLGLHQYPVELYVTTDGLVVTKAAPEHAALLGCRVTTIGDRTPEEAMDAVRPFVSRDNEMGVRSQGPRYLTVAEGLHFGGITPSADAMTLGLEKPDGARFTAELTPQTMGDQNGWVTAGHDAGGPAPLFRRHRNKVFWFEHMEDENLVYFQYNAIRDAAGETVAEFVERLFAFIDDNDVEHLVVDLRWNGGGNSYLNVPLVRALMTSEAINRPGGLYVITSRHTFSAAQNLATDIEFSTEAIFVGEPTGSRPNFIGETSPVTLPYTGLQFTCSSRYHQHSFSNDHRMWIAPKIVAELSWKDILTNGDPAMEAIKETVRAETLQTSAEPIH